MTEELHQPLASILDRQMAIALNQADIAKCGPYLRDLVNYSTKLLIRCERSLKGIPGTPASLIHLYYHAIQMADGIEALAAQACFAATAPLQRSLLETTMSMEYMLRDVKRFELLSGAWMVRSFLTQKKYWDLLRNSSSGWDEAGKRTDPDSFDATFGRPQISPDEIELILQSIDKQLNKPKFAPISEKFIGGKKQFRKWYQIEGGPGSMKELARELNQTWLYNVFYAQDSEALHGCDSQRMLTVEECTPVMVPIRPGAMSAVTPENTYRIAASLLVHSSLLIASKLRPEEPLALDIKEIMRRHLPGEMEAVGG